MKARRWLVWVEAMQISSTLFTQIRACWARRILWVTLISIRTESNRCRLVVGRYHVRTHERGNIMQKPFIRASRIISWVSSAAHCPHSKTDFVLVNGCRWGMQCHRHEKGISSWRLMTNRGSAKIRLSRIINAREVCDEWQLRLN